MKVHIINEQEKYLPIINYLENQQNLQVSTSNLDFDNTRSIRDAKIIIFFGTTKNYRKLADSYASILDSKLVLSTAEKMILDSQLEVQINVIYTVVICCVNIANYELSVVVSQTIDNLFASKYQSLICDNENYRLQVETISKFIAQIKSTTTNYQQLVPAKVLVELLKNISD